MRRTGINTYTNNRAIAVFRHGITAVLTILCFAMTPPLSRAQTHETGESSDRGRVVVTANVISSTTRFNVVQPLQFGDVHLGMGNVTVEKQSPLLGEIAVKGSANTSLIVSYMLTPNGRLELRGAGVAGYLPIQLMLYGGSTDQPGAAEIVTNGSVVNLTEEGRYFFYVGGILRVGLPGDVPPGQYRGMMTMRVSYQ